MDLLNGQIERLEAARREALREGADLAVQEVNQMIALKGIGSNSAIEIAWGWLRFQPRSALTRWYQNRFGSGSSRLRRIGIVELARNLLIALWQYLETGSLPEGAELKPALKIW